jgi:hypothetical protein
MSNGSTINNISESWFDPFPIDDYNASLEKSALQSLSKQTSCPQDYTLGDLSVSCGPTVRFLASHEDDSNNYRGSILLIVRDFPVAHQIPNVLFTLGPSNKKENGQFITDKPTKAEIIYKEELFTFFRFSFDFELQNYEQKVKYSVNDESLPHFQFFLPSIDQSMNVMSYSCNGFSLNTDTTKFRGSLWLDVMRKHSNPSFHYHVMIGGGDQIYADSIKNTSPEFTEWLKHKHIHSTDKLTDKMRESFNHYYLNRYIEWFGKGYWVGPNGRTIQSVLPMALASIPQINIFDDHDIIDGFGSYSDITMRQQIFQGVGQEAFKYYMLFQHHTPYDEPPENERSWIVGKTKGPYIDQLSRSVYARLGASIGFLGLDCRTERTKHQVVSEETYDIVFNRLLKEIKLSKDINKPIKHLYVLLGIPIAYPRMVFIERIMDSPLIGPILYLARKGIIARGLVNEFDGEVELLDDLNDHWCAHFHKKERNKFMERLMKVGAENNVRITILSGDVHLSCISRFRNNDRQLQAQNDPKFIINLISSAIVNIPPPNGMVKFLSMRAKKHFFVKSTTEDMIPLFKYEPDSVERKYSMFMNKRNFSDLIPISNLSKEYITQRYGVEKEGKYYIPGFVKGESKYCNLNQNVVEAAHANASIGYSFDYEGILATLHVEVESENTDSKTGDYDVLIPSLQAN